MTTPAQPDTGAGAAPDTGTSAPTTEPAKQPEAPDTDTTDWKAEAEKYKTLARKHEERAKASKAKLDAKSPAAQPEGEPTLETLQQQLAEANEAREAAETAAIEATYTSTVTRVAAQVGADVEALLDSGSFRDAVGELLDDDFDDDDLRAAIEKTAKEYAKKPRFAANAATGPPRGGADMTGGAPPPARQRPNSLHGALKGTYGS